MSRTYSIVDEGRFDELTTAQSLELQAQEAAGRPMARIVLTWEELEVANEPDTMDEIAELEVGQSTILGMCDPIERLS